MSILHVATEALGGGPLGRHEATGRSAWSVARPEGVEGWRARMESTRASFARHDWSDALAPALAAEDAARARLTRVADAHGVVVTTGQQPGLFGGPLYTLYKALSALALADALEAATGIPTAPVFWAATDDTDLEEARHAAVALPGGMRALSIDAPSVHDGRALAEVPLGSLEGPLAAVLEAAGSGAGAAVVERLRDQWRPEATLGGAYVALLREVLQPLGIAVLDAWHPALRRAASAPLRHALAEASGVASALSARTAEIRAAGFTPQVHDAEGLSLVWGWQAGGRRRFSVAEAVEAAHGAHGGAPDAERSATVLLRPALERQLLPTVAYVAGPGELAYFAQVSPVAAALGWAAPLAVPRWSGTVVEPHVARLLARLGLEGAALGDRSAVETAVAAEAVPVALREALEGVREAVRQRFAALRPAASALVPEAVTEGAARQVLHKLDRLERRVVAAAKRRETERMRDVGTVLGALRPGGGRQERVLSWAPLLARHGPALLDAVRSAAERHAAALVHGAPATAG